MTRRTYSNPFGTQQEVAQAPDWLAAQRVSRIIPAFAIDDPSDAVLETPSIRLDDEAQTIDEDAPAATKAAFVTFQTAEDPAGSDMSPEEEDSEREREEAQQQALVAGIEEGRAQARAEVSEKLEALEQIIRDLSREKHRLLAQTLVAAQGEMISLVLEIAKTVIGREVADDGSYLETLIAESIGLLHSAATVEIRIASTDYDEVSAIAKRLEQEASEPLALRVAIDDSIHSGCILETQTARVDAQLDRRLAHVAALLGGGVS